MPLYRCLILGENFPGALLGEPEPVGFYTTRYVEAGTAEAAELLALEMLRNDKALKVAPGAHTKEARIHFEQIEEVPPETERVPNAGFTFFNMGS